MSRVQEQIVGGVGVDTKSRTYNIVIRILLLGEREGGLVGEWVGESVG